MVMALAWAALFGIVSLIITRNEKVSFVVTGLVFSNWFLNLIFHHADMYLLPSPDQGSYKWGLGLWNSVAGTIVV